MKQRPRIARKFVGIAGAMLLTVVISLYFLNPFETEIEERIAEPAPTLEIVATPELATAEELEFYDFVAPRLLAIAAEAGELTALGEARSRNIIELQIRSDRVTKLLDDVDTFIAENGVPARFIGSVAAASSGATLLRQGNDDARAAFFRFDWDALGVALALFAKGTEQINVALREMTTIVEPLIGTPVSSIGGAGE